MEKIIFYKFKRVNNDWHVLFQDENGNSKLISNNRDMLIEFIKENNDCIFIGANNFIYDDVLLTSILKDNTMFSNVNPEDKASLLPRTLDITQGIVRNTLVDFRSSICCLWNQGTPLVNYYVMDSKDIAKELLFEVETIKELYKIDERKKFIDWKIELIKKYNLPKEAYNDSFGMIMQRILGLNINNINNRRRKRVVLDSRLESELKAKNDPYLNQLLITLKNYYESEEEESPSELLGNCAVKFNHQGIHGSMKEDYIDTTGDKTYLYIDFNSFGPSILINNNWLKDSAKNPERYKEVRDLRLKLKSEKQMEQLFYKNILNSGLDDLTNVYTKDGKNVGYSLTLSGIMIMMLLYRNIEKYKTELIECNTDGLIVKCNKSVVENIRNEVKELEQKLSLSCDVDVVNKIVHFDDKNYIMEFENGKTKHLGVFGLFQDNQLNDKGVFAIDEALRNYYLYDIPVSQTIRKLRDNNNLRAFQIVKKKKSNEKPKYLLHDGKYVLNTCQTNRLFAVEKEKLNNPFYTEGKKGEYELYRSKRGKVVKDGYYYFEVSDMSVPNINDIDLTYYIDECYKVINAHPKKQSLNVNFNRPTGFAFLDIDGTIIEDTPAEAQKRIFLSSVGDIDTDFEQAYDLLCNSNGCYLIQFLGLCKKYKGFGTVDNFAEFLYSKRLFGGNYTLNDYKGFVRRFLLNSSQNARNLPLFDKSKEMIEKLKEEGYVLSVYSNWFAKVQDAKLRAHRLGEYFTKLFTIDEYYAKSSVKGWEDVLAASNIDKDDLVFMIGNGTSDLVPKTLGIPSIITNHKQSVSKTAREKGLVINSFDEIIDKNFTKEMRLIKNRMR